MKRSFFLMSVIILTLMLVGPPARAAILIEGPSTVSGEPGSPHPVFQDNYELRRKRKVGFGWHAGGNLGLLGLQVELSFTPNLGFLGGFGISQGYQSYALQLKRVFQGRRLSPFVSGGLAQWYSVGTSGPLERSTPNFLVDRFLSRQQSQTGRFSETLLFPSVGVQYLQLGGEWQGMSLALEALFLIDVGDWVAAPSVGIGAMYYF